jgi:hypothetical protein
MAWLFSVATFVGVMTCALVRVTILGHVDPKFGVAGSLVAYGWLFAPAIPISLIGFAIASRGAPHRRLLVCLGGLLTGTITFALQRELDHATLDDWVLFGLCAAWVLVASVLLGRLTRERHGTRLIA